MMKLSSMRTVCETILPGGRCPVVEHVLAPWDHDASSNFTASFTNGGERRIVRFVRTDERQRDTTEAELDFLRHVAEHGAWGNLPITSRGGRCIESVATPLGEFHAVVFNAMAGETRESGQLRPRRTSRGGAPSGSCTVQRRDTGTVGALPGGRSSSRRTATSCRTMPRLERRW
jgi:hypothetical protein